MQIHSEEFGQGAPVVLLHGVPADPAELRPLARRLGQKRRVLLMHLPGYGQTPAPRGPWALSDQHGWIERELSRRGIAEAALVGVSAGAYGALALALRGRIRATQVITLGGFAGLAEPECAGLRGFAEALRAGVDLGEVLVARFLAPEFARARPELARTVQSYLDAAPRAHIAAELEALAASADLRPELHSLDVPVLARVGELDLAAPPAQSEQIVAWARHAELEIVPGAGHLLLLEDEAQTLAAVERALSARG